ncbi:MAG: c-type cytochrome, partial [Deltaproteobacteria bacterium]|nr:c-type cytochrome [Deltaproteobacteria bacterium]
LLLPLALLSLCALHVGLVRKHGVTPPPGLTGEAKNRRATFFPVQALYDACFSLALLLGLVAFAIAKPAGLLGPADASAQMPARPDWVFLPLFQLLKLLPSALEGAVALLIPLVLLGLLAALPFLDKKRRSNETWKDRLPIVGALTAVLAITLVLGLVSKAHDSGDDAFQASMAQATDRAQVAMALGTNGVPPQGALFQVHDQPQMRGERLFQKKCLSCHKVGDAGTRYGPELSGYLSRAWIRGALVHPEEPEYWGKTGIIGMETFESLGEQNLSILVDMLHSLRTVTGGPESIPPAHATALKLFEQHCADCHTLKPNEKSPGPSLVRWGSDPWLRAMINDPSVPFLYGAQNKMPHFGDELEAKEIDDLVAYLRTLEPLAAPKLPKVAKARSKR